MLEDLLESVQKAEDNFHEEKLIRLKQDENKFFPDVVDKFGNFTIDLKKLLQEDGTVSSKQILYPFLKEEEFESLEVVCDHVPKWFDRELEGMSYNFHVATRKDGTLNVEYLTFYENGNIETLYPLNGQLSPYWQENQEYELAQSYEISLPFRKIKAKIKALYFYQTGELKGITMWSGERIEVPTPLGNQPTRLGIGFFENGTVKSFEPAEPLSLNTPIGKVIAFDANNYSYFRESKAVTFTKDGQIETIFTSNNIISVTDSDGELTDFAPTCYEDEYSESNIYVYPMQIDFEEGNITFNRVDIFKLSETKFSIHEMLIEMEKQECTEDCSTCSSTCTPGGISMI